MSAQISNLWKDKVGEMENKVEIVVEKRFDKNGIWTHAHRLFGKAVQSLNH